MASSSSDEVMNLPRVPRVRRGGTKGSNVALDTAPKITNPTDDSTGESSRKPRESSTRARGKRKPITESVHSDEDENELDDESEENIPMRRTKRQPRRTLQSRKIKEEDDDEDDEDDDDDGDDEMDEDHKEQDSESDSPPPPVKKISKRVRDTSSDSNSKDDEEEGDDDSEDTKKVIAGQEKIMAQLAEAEEMDDGSDPLDSDDSEIEKQTQKKPERLTRRQRAMQGENVKLEYTRLESPKSKKAAPPEEEWSNDEEAELKKQQRARLRQMIHEKRNKEKRAAMVDKVLRGVTSKRKKLTMATEERVAKVGTRLSRNEMREGCIRFVSNTNGMSISIPKEDDAPEYLQASIKAAYPPRCTRDPKTGKRIFAES